MTPTPHHRGILEADREGRHRIRFERTLPGPPEQAWDWIVDPELRERWLPGCDIDARPGGAVRFDFGDEGAATGTVTEARRPGTEGRLVHTWVWHGVPESTVTWTLAPYGEDTRLTLLHSEVEPEPAGDFAIGWHLILDALTETLDGGDPDRAWARIEQVAALYA